MAYNSITSAEALIGQTVSQEQLNAARSIINSFSEYRWESTTITETFSGDSESLWLELRAPIISVSSFVIDDVSQTLDTDYEIRKPEGRIRIFSGLPWGNDNIVITYNYGWTTTYQFYNDTFLMVQMTEAQIALYIKKNPLFLDSVSLEGSTINFSDSHIYRYLSQIPKEPMFVSMGPRTLIEPLQDTLIE